MTGLQRIQRKRTKCWRMPEGAIYVGRPSRWGNHWRVTPFMGGWSVDTDYDHTDVYENERAARTAAVDLFSLHIGVMGSYEYDDETLEKLRRDLASHDLACWCPEGQPCHADVLLELANA